MDLSKAFDTIDHHILKYRNWFIIVLEEMHLAGLSII